MASAAVVAGACISGLMAVALGALLLFYCRGSGFKRSWSKANDDMDSNGSFEVANAQLPVSFHALDDLGELGLEADMGGDGMAGAAAAHLIGAAPVQHSVPSTGALSASETLAMFDAAFGTSTSAETAEIQSTVPVSSPWSHQQAAAEEEQPLARSPGFGAPLGADHNISSLGASPPARWEGSAA